MAARAPHTLRLKIHIYALLYIDIHVYVKKTYVFRHPTCILCIPRFPSYLPYDDINFFLTSCYMAREIPRTYPPPLFFFYLKFIYMCGNFMGANCKFSLFWRVKYLGCLWTFVQLKFFSNGDKILSRLPRESKSKPRWSIGSLPGKKRFSRIASFYRSKIFLASEEIEDRKSIKCCLESYKYILLWKDLSMYSFDRVFESFNHSFITCFTQ